MTMTNFQGESIDVNVCSKGVTRKATQRVPWFIHCVWKNGPLLYFE